MSLDKPYYLGGRAYSKYDLKGKRYRGLIQVPDQGFFEHKRKQGGIR